ncbi:phospholipase D/nuclease [Pterulicium gracile]|uniref:Phospholipase n=1 Tax=Pterulicium gracile TaxID=1884261 RepID=A0A5C3Q1B9_9AGAR|nr:phospholipase D/nuclease [Pterula gracilis]
MSFFKNLKNKVEQAADKLPQGLMNARAEAIGLWNPNRRHDEPHEIENDRVREDIMQGHRFRSFANERNDNTVKWHIDGHDYMWAMSELLDKAKEAIFILDWWLTPELFLRRPPARHPEWRLDRLLKRKAEEGVKVYVIVYKEVTQTMSMSSKHTKNYLEGLHPNIVCLRHPDHVGSKDSVQFWSHHEKVVVVDNHYACIGGLDLCFGRWDTHNHPCADCHPTDFSKTLFPGQDYNNARVMDFQNVFNYASNAISVLESPRMPWHDVHMTLTGPVVLDIVQHFVERWNEIKKRKYRDKENVDWLSLPHNVQASPNEAVARHPHRDEWQNKGRRFKQRFHFSSEEEQEEHRNSEYHGGRDRRDEGEDRDGDRYRDGERDGDRYRGGDRDGERRSAREGTCRVQVVRSVSDWSHGVLTECSIQNAYVESIRDARHYIYIENQFFITATKTGGQVVNQIGKALVDRIVQAAQNREKFKVVVVIPEVPGFAGDVKTESSIKYIMAAQYRSINRGGDSIYEQIRRAGYEPLDYIRFYHLRSYDRINAPMPTFINQMEENSGVRFHEAQVALSRLLIGTSQTDQREVTLAVPEPMMHGLVEGGTAGHKTGEGNTQKPNTITIPIPESEDAAREIIERFERGAEGVRGDEEVSDSVAQHMLGDRTGLKDEKWLGTEEEELKSYVSELLYIHTKLMIVDDARVIMGSANINDRSQKGDGDSEIALVVEDMDLIDATMGGQHVMVSRFASSLRRKLYREHIGLIEPQNCGIANDRVTSFMRAAPHANKDEFDEEEDRLVADPLADDTWRLWNETAKRNTQIFTELFRPVPTNLVRDWGAYDNYVAKVKPGHVVEGISLETVKDRLSEVKGALIECPLDFLIDQRDFVEGPEWRGFDPTLPIYI